MAKLSRLTFISLFTVYAFVFVLWLLYRFTTHNPEIIDEALVKPVLWLGPVYLLHQKKKIRLRSFLPKKVTLRLLLFSVATGAALALLQIVPNALKGHAIPHLPADMPVLTLATVCTALTEELFFRGFLLTQLRLRMPALSANLISAALFAAIHIPLFIFINHASAAALAISVYTVFASGFVFGLLYLYTGNLTSSIIAHFVLNTLLLML